MMTDAPLPPKKNNHFRSLDSAPATEDDLTFTVCTYNVLIQDFVSLERYPTVENPSLVFDKDRRRNMLMQDVQQLKSHADVFCFEEMCPDLFEAFQTALGKEFAGDLVKRQANRPLHNAMFYNTSKLTLEHSYHVNLHKGLVHISAALKEDTDLAPFQDLEFYTICNHFSFRQSHNSNKNTTTQKKHLLVMMAHLHHDPRHDVIKYAEMSGLLNELSRLYHQLILDQDVSANDIYIVVAGDFNAQPSNQVYALLSGEEPTQKALEEETTVRPEWLQRRLQWLPLYQQIYNTTDTTFLKEQRLQSVYSQYGDLKGEKGHPRYTNLTDSFANTIDYIFYDATRLSPIQLLELDTETYEQEEFLPSSLHASDHVILMAEFRCL